MSERDVGTRRAYRFGVAVVDGRGQRGDRSLEVEFEKVMTNEELIARQAKQIEELKDRVAGFVEMTKTIRMQIIRIGGPLNDNIDGYTNKQLAPFGQIMSLTEGRLLDEEWK